MCLPKGRKIVTVTRWDDGVWVKIYEPQICREAGITVMKLMVCWSRRCFKYSLFSSLVGKWSNLMFRWVESWNHQLVTFTYHGNIGPEASYDSDRYGFLVPPPGLPLLPGWGWHLCCGGVPLTNKLSGTCQYRWQVTDQSWQDSPEARQFTNGTCFISECPRKFGLTRRLWLHDVMMRISNGPASCSRDVLAMSACAWMVMKCEQDGWWM